MENITYNELEVGASKSRTIVITEADIQQSATLFRDANPVHLNDKFAKASIFGARIAHGMMSAGLISGVIGEELPGPGTIYVQQDLKFLAPVYIGDEITITVCVAEKRDGKTPGKGRALLDTICTNQNGIAVSKGQALVQPPSEKIIYTPESDQISWDDPVL
tara:strand:- start:120 stop:605 length:486 start_codon:yes stop_codon:yes gene_type:complete